jgi:hypothetical protein
MVFIGVGIDGFYWGGHTRHRTKDKQARDTGNIGHTRHRTKDKQNTKTQHRKLRISIQ